MINSTKLLSEEFSPPMKFDFPPLKQGEYIEKYFMKYIEKNKIVLKRKYLNVMWSTLYYDRQFKNIPYNAQKLEQELNKLPRDDRYFAISQYSSPIYHTLPPDTMSIGNSLGTVPMPLLYENKEVFDDVPYRSWEDKKIFCGFVGGTAGPVRALVKKYADQFSDYHYDLHPGDGTNKEGFLENVYNTKFCLAPRGFGRSSYRFFEVALLGSVPVYVWDDKNWLPFRNKIDYSKFSIVINIADIDKLDPILRSITKEKYGEMIEYTKSISHLYTFEGACKEFVNVINRTVYISSHAGLGDQLIGYACSEVLSHGLGARTLLDLNIFDSPECPVTINDLYRAKEVPKDSYKLNIDCQPGRDMMDRLFQERSFWEKLGESGDIHINNHTYILPKLVNNKVGSISFKNDMEIVKEMRRAMQRLFNRYCTVDRTGIEYDTNTVVIHVRTGDDIFMLNNIRLPQWPSHINNQIRTILSSISKHLIDHPPSFGYKITVLSDVHPEDIYKLAKEYIPNQTFDTPTAVLSKHSVRQKPSKTEWCKIMKDFFSIANAKRTYLTPNSNFSRAAVLYGKETLSSSYFVRNNGDINQTMGNILHKEHNTLY